MIFEPVGIISTLAHINEMGIDRVEAGITERRHIHR